ncbi:spermidine/putrescine ABC transporter permease [Aureimonas endophytica]|uniref:Spermidine/putrescine ABC transporter permease n=1 Tax=Aureimonas endophytica TaxID=2027858 RepID=A0A917E5B2_9HYPH|nr:spermidine/putrescine ABC transporter permease [Aureimonas endophytica]GGE05832.1 spermidine/putrescine ABC transporter permease [Aureimonas endophytica]
MRTIARLTRRLLLALMLAYFALPLLTTLVFSLSQGRQGYGLSAYAALIRRADLLEPLLLSIALAAATIALVLVVLLPAMIAMHLLAPRLKGLFEAIAVLPFVVPAIALVAGLTALVPGPGWLVGSPAFLALPCFVLALPYAYRAIDVGLGPLDLPQLRLAAASLGAGPVRTILWVVLPNLGPALVNAALLTFTVVLGEFTVANILLFPTFPVALARIGRSQPDVAAALSIVSFLLTWAALFGALRAGRLAAPRAANRDGVSP